MLLRKKSSGRFWPVLISAVVLCLSIVRVSSIYAQSEEIEKINEKAEKYFDLLSENPGGDYLYDRFYDAWLDTGTVEGLEQFLKVNISRTSEFSGHLLLAFFYERQGKDKEALEHFNESSKIEPKPDVLYQKASVEARLLDLDSAISDLLEAEKANKGKDKELSIKISKLLAKLYIRTGNKDSAAEVWEKLIESNPDDEEIYEDMIELQVSEGLYDEAIDTSDKLLEITKDSYKKIMRQLRKADIYQYSGKNEQALDIYSKTLTLVGQGTWLENQICSQVERVYRRQDDIRSLQDYWEKIIEEEPQRISIKKRLAQLLLQFAEVDKALNLYREIVRVTPGDKINQQAYIKALRSVSQTSKAIELMEQLCKQNPDDRELLIDLADLYYLNRDNDAVVKTLEKFLDESDKTEYVFMRVARILENYNYKEEVFGVFEKLISKYPDSLTAKEAYAEILYKYDKKDKAIELWENLVAIGDFQTLLRISKTVSARGYSQSALKWLEARYNEFENDIAYMNQLCEIAIRLRLYEKCRPWLQKQLMMADRSSLIQAAIKQKLQLEKYSGKLYEAMEELKAQKSRSVQETCLLSELLEYNRLPEEAQDVLDEFLIDVNNFNLDDAARKSQKEIAIHQKIHLYSVSKQWEQAAECTKKLIAMKGTQDSAYVLELINLYERAGKWDLALEWIPAWKRASPGSTEPILAESRILRRLYKIDTAIERLRAAEQVFENNKDILSELASLYRSYNRPSEAYRITWRLFDEAEDPSDKLGYVRDLAVIARNMGNMENLIGKLQEQRSNNRTSVVPLLALAEVYRQAEKYEERLQVLMEATRLKPNDITLLSEIARIEESEGFWEQAIDTLQQALPLDATDSTKQKLARLYIQYGNEEEGYRLLFDLNNKATTDPLEVLATIRTLLTETNWEMAEKYLAEVLPAFPDDYRLHYLYGLCLEENGKYQDALEKFIQIIGMKTEVPDIASQNAVPQQPSYVEMLNKIAPPGVAEILSLQQVFSRAMSYNREYDNLPYWYYPSRSRQSININIPQKVEEVSGFAAAQIILILNNDSMLDSPEIDSQFRDSILKTVLQEYNLSGLEFILDNVDFNIDNLNSSIAEIAPKYPDNEALQGFWVIYYNSNTERDEKHVRHVFDMFKESYPSLSCMLGLMYGVSNETGSDILEQSLKMISKLDEPDQYLMSRITQTLRNQDSLLTQNQKTVLTDKLLSWYDELSSDPSQNPNQANIAYNLLNTLFYTGETDVLVKVLNKEIEKYKNNPNQMQQNTSTSQSDVRIQNLNYPYIYNLSDFPSSLASVIYQGTRESISQGSKLFEPNNIDNLINQIKEPLLQAVIYMGANQDEKALGILENKLDTEPNSISACIMAASILARQNKLDEAILLLARIQSMSPDASVQLTVDGAIVFYSRNIDIAQNQEALNAAREAAMRLTKGQFSRSGYHEVLIQAMENLGLQDEARLFAQRYTPTISSQGIQSMYGIQGLPQQMIQQAFVSQGRTFQTTGRTQDLSTIQYNKILNLLQEDRKDAAIRLLITDLKTIAGDSLLPERFNYNNSNTRNRITLVHAHNLEDKIIELANPAPSKNVRQMLIYARLCDLIERKDEAKQAYEKILEFRPKEFGALLWLAFEYAEQEPDKAVKYLLAVDRRYQNQLGRQISNYIQNNYNNQENFESIFQYTAMATLYLDTLKDPNSLDLSWAANIPNTLARAYSRNNIRLPQLYSESQTDTENNVIWGRTGRINEYSAQDAQELIKKRREVHNEFCNAMLRIPQLSAQGFASLHSEARARNAVDDSIAAIALEALLKYNSTRNYSNGGLISSYNWGTGKDYRLLSPMEFLLYQNWKDETLDEFIEKVTPILENNNRIGEMKQLKILASLYQAPAENFVDQAKTFLESDIISGSSSPYSRMSKQSALTQIMDIRSDRSLKVSLNQFLLSMIDANNMNSIYQVQDTIRVYMTQLAKEDTETANEFIEEVVTVFLGPKEKRQEFIAQNYSQGRSSGNIQGERIQVCFNLLRNLAQNGELLFTILSQFENLESYISDMRYFVQNGIDNVIQRAISSSTSQSSGNQDDFTKLLSMLNDSPFLSDVNSFRTLPVSQLQKSSVYSYMLYRFWRSQSNQYTNARSILRQTLSNNLSQKTGDDGFGTELLIAQLSENRRPDVYSCLAKYWEQFQKLDAARQQEISVMICETVGLVLPEDNSLSDDLKTIVAQLNKLVRDASQEKLNTFLKNKQFEDFNISDSQFFEYASNLTNSLASYDVDASVQILLKAIKIIDDARSRGKFQQYYTNREFMSNILNKMQQDRGSMTFGSLGFIVKLFRDVNEPSLDLEPYYVNRFEDTLYDHFRQLRSSSNNNNIEALKKLYNDIGPNVGKGDLSGINIFRRVFESSNWNEQLINEAINWANEQAESGNYTDLARALAANASLYKQRRFMNRRSSSRGTLPSNRGQDTPDTAEQYYMDSLMDSNLPVLWRLMANYSMTQNYSNIVVSDQLLKQAVELVIKAWKTYPNLNAEYCTNTVNRFINILVPERNPQSNRAQISSNTTPITRAEWTDTATRFADVYMTFRQPAQVSTTISPVRYSQPSGYESNASIQLAMIEINLVLNRDDAVRAMLDGFDNRAGTYIDCWALLVKYNKPHILQSVVEKQWSNSINQMGNVRFDKEIEKNLPGCLDVIQSEDLKFLAQVLISSLQDEGGNEQRPSVQRNERLKNLAGKIGEITFNSVPVKQRILEIYTNETQLIPLVTEHLAEEGKKINLNALLASQDSNLVRTQSQLMVAYCMSSLLKGDPNIFIQTVHACEVYTNPNQSQPLGARQVLENLGRQLTNMSETIRTNWTESQVSSLATATAEYLSNSSGRYYNSSRIISDLVIFHVLANRENEIPAALEKINYEMRQNLRNYLNLSEMNSSLARYTRERNLTLKERIDIIKRFYQTDPVQEAMERDNRRDMLSYLTSYNVLSRQEIDQNRDLLKDLFIQTKNIEIFLKASSVTDIVSIQNESQFRQHIISLLNSTMWQDSELCRKILLQAKFLYVRAGWSSENAMIHQPGVNQGNERRLSGNEFISNILLQRDSSNFSSADIGIIVDLTRDANSPQIVLNQDYLQRISSIVYDRYRQSLREYNQNQLEALKAFYSQIGPYFGKGDASGYSMFWANVLQANRNNTYLESVKEWANEQIEKGEYPNLAKEISFSLTRQTGFPPRAARGGRGNPVTTGGSEIDETMRKYYLDVLADSKLSVIWRLMALEEYRKRSRFDSNLNDENADTIFKAMPLLIEGFKRYPDLHETYYTNLVSSFAKLQNRPEWKELAGKLSEAYEQFKSKESNLPVMPPREEEISFLQRTGSGMPVIIAVSNFSGGGFGGFGTSTATRGFRGTPPPFLMEQEPQMDNSQSGMPVQNDISPADLSMLEIRLALNEDELIKKQLFEENCSLSLSLDVWALMAQHGRDSILKEVIEKNWQKVSMHSNLLFTKELEASIARCLKEIRQEDMRYFTEVVLSSLSDSTLQDEVPIVSHKNRITHLAEQYSKVNFNNRILKQRILALMINEPDALKFLSDSLAEQAAKIDINSLFSNFDNAARDQFNLVLAYCCEKILKGDPNSFVKMVQNVAVNASSSRQSIGRMLITTISDNLMKTADCTKNNWSEAQMAAFASASTEILAQESFSLRNSNSFFINHYIFFILGGVSDKLQNAYRRFSSLSSQIQQNMQRLERLPEYYAELSGYLANRNLSLEQRLDIIKHFNSADWISDSWSQMGRGMPSFNIVQLLVERKIFSRQETIDNASYFSELTNPAINYFLNIKNAAVLDNDIFRLDSYVNNLVESVTIYDTDLLLKIILKTDELYQQILNSGTTNIPFELNVSERMLSRLVRQDTNWLQGLNIIVKLMRDTKDVNIFPDNNLYQIDRELVSLFTQTPQSQINKLDTLKNIYQQIGQFTGEGNASGISGIFSILFSNQQWRDSRLLDSVIQWSRQQAQSGDYPSLAREIEMVAIVYSSMPAFGTTIDSEKIKPVIEYYQNVLNDESLSPAWRLMTIHAMERWINYPVFNELIDQAVMVLTSCSDQSSRFNWDSHSNILSPFVSFAHQETLGMMQPNNPDYDFSPLRSSWTAAALKALDSYMKYRARRNDISRSSFQGRIGTRQSASISELVMLEVSLLLKENEVARKLLWDSNGTLKTSSCTLSLLIQYQNNALLKEFAEENMESVKLDSRGVYNSQLEDRINESLNNISEPDIQYLIKLFLYSHNNRSQRSNFSSRTEEQDNLATRQQRLEILAKEFNEIEFNNETIKKNALTYLIQEVSVLPYISKAVNEEAKKINLASMSSSSSSSSYYVLESPDFQIYLADKMSLLMNGDPNGFQNIIRFSRSILNSDMNLSINIITSLTSAYLRVVTGTDWDAEMLPAYLNVSNELLSALNIDRGFNSNVFQLICCKVALLLLDDESSDISQNKLKEIESVFNILTPYREMFQGSQMNIAVRSNDIQTAYRVMARYMNSLEMDFEKRIEILNKLYSLRQIADAMSQTSGNSTLPTLMNERVFSIDEIINHTDTLMSLPVISQNDWQFLAFFQSRQGSMDDAEKTWRKAVEMGIKGDSAWTGMPGYLYFLNNNNLREKALEYWQSFDIKSLSPKSLNEYNNLIQSLSSQIEYRGF